jgi:hypothetical protein
VQLLAADYGRARQSRWANAKKLNAWVVSRHDLKRTSGNRNELPAAAAAAAAAAEITK